MTSPIPTVLVHIGTSGEVSYHVDAPDEVRFLVVDERSPCDRVYRMSVPTSASELAGIIGEGEIGSAFDARHAALAERVRAIADKRSHLSVVE